MDVVLEADGEDLWDFRNLAEPPVAADENGELEEIFQSLASCCMNKQWSAMM